MQKLRNTHLTLSPVDRVYCLSDIHGHPDVLRADYELIQKDLINRPLLKGQFAHIIHLGDMCDKGPDTNTTFTLINQRILSDNASRRIRVHLIAGNHEQGLYDFVAGPEAYKFPEGLEAYSNDPAARKQLARGYAELSWHRESIDWIINGGGLQTLQSYGVLDNDLIKLFKAAKEEFVRKKDDILTEANLRVLKRIRVALRRKMSRAKHIGMLAKQYSSAECGHIFFCHAGIDPSSGVLLSQQSLDIKTSAKISKARTESYQGYHLMHGHKSGKDAPRIGPFSIGIDPKTMRTNKGLVACFEGEEVRFINTDDKIWTAPFMVRPGKPIVFPEDTTSHPSRIHEGRLVRPALVA